MVVRTAILVDGGFYRKRAKTLWGIKTAEGRAKELEAYCRAHIHDGSSYEQRQLYRIFYYDCKPVDRRSVFHPFTKSNVDLDKSDTYTWTNLFMEELKKRRKSALRLGELSKQVNYNLKPAVTKQIFIGKMKLEDVTENDFELNISQKGVDTKICLDMASLAYKKQVDQIILIAGDSDFVPAAKLARREGVDIILDPLWADITDNLFEHIDGLKSQWRKKGKKPSHTEAFG